MMFPFTSTLVNLENRQVTLSSLRVFRGDDIFRVPGLSVTAYATCVLRPLLDHGSSREQKLVCALPSKVSFMLCMTTLICTCLYTYAQRRAYEHASLMEEMTGPCYKI